MSGFPTSLRFGEARRTAKRGGPRQGPQRGQRNRGSAPDPGSVACGGPNAPRRSLAGALCAPRTVTRGALREQNSRKAPYNGLKPEATYGHISRTLPYKTKGHRNYAVPLASIGLAPPAFTAPCRNQTDDALPRGKRRAASFPQECADWGRSTFRGQRTLVSNLQVCRGARRKKPRESLTPPPQDGHDVRFLHRRSLTSANVG